MGDCMEVPQAIHGSSADVVEQPHSFVPRDFAFGKHMEACGKMFCAVGLLCQVEQPTGLWQFVVPIESRRIQGLMGHFSDGRLASPKRRMLKTIVGERSERDHRELDGRPVDFPKLIEVTAYKSMLQGRRGQLQM